jgi:hypothetical protein
MTPANKPYRIKSIVLGDDELAALHALLPGVPGLPMHAVMRAALRLGLSHLRGADAADLVLAHVPTKQATRCQTVRKAIEAVRINSTPPNG